jgi:hypothetical protein
VSCGFIACKSVGMQLVPAPAPAQSQSHPSSSSTPRPACPLPLAPISCTHTMPSTDWLCLTQHPPIQAQAARKRLQQEVVAAQAEAAESAAALQKLRGALKEAEEAQLESAAAARKLRSERDALEAVGGMVGPWPLGALQAGVRQE